MRRPQTWLAMEAPATGAAQVPLPAGAGANWRFAAPLRDVPGLTVAAGRQLLYPSTSLRHVRPVTRGARLASFFSIEGMLRDDGRRTLLFDLEMAVQRIRRNLPDHPAVVELTGVYHNLLRHWAEV